MSIIVKDFRNIKLLSSKSVIIDTLSLITNQLNELFKEVNCTFIVDELWQDQYDIRVDYCDIRSITDKLLIRILLDPVNKAHIAKNYHYDNLTKELKFIGLITVYTVEDIIELVNSKQTQLMLYNLYHLLEETHNE